MTMRANYFNLLLVLLMGVLPIQLQASESEKNVILYTPYTKIAVPPGESVNYSIDVINNYDVVKNVNLSVKGLPRGWNYELKAGTWTISELAVLPGGCRGTWRTSHRNHGIQTRYLPNRFYHESTQHARELQILVYLQRHAKKPNGRTTALRTDGASP